MDSGTILLFVVPLVLGILFNAMKFMRFIGFVASGGKSKASARAGSDSLLSFDERLAERLRDLERDHQHG